MKTELISVALIAGLLAGLLTGLVSYIPTGTYQEPLAEPEDYSYLITKLDNCSYAAKNGTDHQWVTAWTSTNATATIQNALNAMITGGKLELQQGTYPILGISVRHSGITLEGCGAETILNNTSTNPAIHITGNASAEIQNDQVTNLKITGNTDTSGNAIQISYAKYVTIKGNWIEKANEGINIDQTFITGPIHIGYGYWISNNVITDTKLHGIHIANYSSIVRITNNIIVSTGAGGHGIYKADNGIDYIFQGNTFQSTEDGINIDPGDSGSTSMIVIEGGDYQNMRNTAIELRWNVNMFTIMNVRVTGADRDGIHCGAYCFGTIQGLYGSGNTGTDLNLNSTYSRVTYIGQPYIEEAVFATNNVYVGNCTNIPGI